MKKIKLEFDNAAGHKLAGLLELPENAISFALFAHSKKPEPGRASDYSPGRIPEQMAVRDQAVDYGGSTQQLRLVVRLP